MYHRFSNYQARFPEKHEKGSSREGPINLAN